MVFGAAVLSLYVALLVARYYEFRPLAYEPKDFERQDLMERTGRSVRMSPEEVLIGTGGKSQCLI